MAILPIRKVGDDVLRQVAKPVDKITKKRKKLIKDMIETMYDADGIGLAAPQIGVSERIIVVDGRGSFRLINSRLKKPAAVRLMLKDFSFRDRNCVKRNANVVVDALDEDGNLFALMQRSSCTGLQHEIDHLNGFCLQTKSNR